MLKIKLEELEIFDSVVKNGSFIKAAEQINVASSVVSRTIKKLEIKLETTLFNRTTRRVFLTQEGQWLLDKASDLINQAQSVESFLLDKHQPPSGTITVDAATPFAIHAIAPLIANFNRVYPKLRVILQSNESNVDLIARKVDIAIRIGQLEDSSLKARKLGDAYRALYASPEYIQEFGAPKNAEELKKHKCLGFIKPQKLNVWPIFNPHEQGTKVTPSTFADNGETIKQLAVNGCGIACISSFTVIEDVKLGRLLPVLSDKIIDQPIPILAVFYSNNEMNNRLRCFLDYLVEHVVF